MVSQGLTEHYRSHTAHASSNGYAQADARFQTLLESAPDAIVIIDGAGQIVIANEQANWLFGYRRDELLGQPIELLIPERFHAAHVHHRSGYAAAPRTRPMGVGHNLVARRKDGTEFPAEVSLSPLEAEEGLLVISAIRDVSERKQVEKALRRQTAFVRLLQQVAVTANQSSSVEEAMQQALDLICAHTGWPVGHVYLRLSERDEALVPASIWHLDTPERFQPFREATEAIRFSPGIGLVGRVLAEGKPAWIADVGGEPSFLRGQLASALGMQSGFAFPVLVGTDVAAVLEFFSTAPAQMDEALLEVMAHVGTQLGRVVERARSAAELERQVQRRTAHLNTLLELSQELLSARGLDGVLQGALSHALALLPEAQSGAIYLYDPASDRLALRASAGFNQLPAPSVPTTLGAIGRAFTTREVQAANPAASSTALAQDLTDERPRQLLQMIDQHDPRSGTLALPLIARDQTIGVLLLMGKTDEDSFGAEARSTLSGLANLTAAAILEEQSARSAATLSRQLAKLAEQQRTLTERLSSAEAAMLQAARLAAVGELAASIAHEINNPLYAARNCLYLLESEPPESVRASDYLTLASEQLARIARIIQRMRDFYRPSRGDLAPTNVNQVLQETLALASLHTRHTAIKMIFAPDHNLPKVLCNADQLRQVFLNLVLNAMDAMSSGGTLTVRTIGGPSMVVIEIEDTGIGIPDDIRAHLFEPFFTNKPNGTGLGLSISAHIVTQHGGQIEVESAEGAGSTFRVVLPYQPNM